MGRRDRETGWLVSASSPVVRLSGNPVLPARHRIKSARVEWGAFHEPNHRQRDAGGHPMRANRLSRVMRARGRKATRATPQRQDRQSRRERALVDTDQKQEDVRGNTHNRRDEGLPVAAGDDRRRCGGRRGHVCDPPAVMDRRYRRRETWDLARHEFFGGAATFICPHASVNFRSNSGNGHVVAAARAINNRSQPGGTWCCW